MMVLASVYLSGKIHMIKVKKITEFHFDLSLHQPPEHSLDQASRVLADLQPGLPLHAGDSGYN